MALKSTREIIKELNRLDLNLVEYETLVKKINSLIKRVPIILEMTKSTEFFFRSRICTHKDIEDISELYAPPSECVKGFQRCNPPRKAMFYASSKRITTLLECNVKSRDIVYLSQWINKEPLPVNTIMANEHEESILKTITPEHEIIYTYLDTIFTRKIHKSFSNEYKITSAITELITNNFNPNNLHKIKSDKNIVLQYPSIHDAEGSYNTIFHPKFAIERLAPLHVMKLKIIKRDKDKVEVAIIDNARDIVNGKIEWLNDKNKIPIPMDKNATSIPLQSTGKNWSVIVYNKEISTKEINTLLNN